MGQKKDKEQFTLLLGLIGLAIGGYFLSLSLYVLHPFWRKGDTMRETILYIVIALLAIFCILLYRRQAEDRKWRWLQEATHKRIGKSFKAIREDVEELKQSDLSARLKAGRAKFKRKDVK